MGTKRFHNTLVVRAIIGAIAGAILGFIVEPLCFWGDPPGDGSIRLPVIGPALGAGVCLLLALLAGGVRLRGFVKHATIGTVVGTILGVLIGASLFPAIMTAFDPHDDLGSKVFAAYQQAGIIFGIPVGAAVGVIVGAIYAVTQRRRNKEAK